MKPNLPLGAHPLFKKFLLAFWGWAGTLMFAPFGLPALNLQLQHSPKWVSSFVFLSILTALALTSEWLLFLIFAGALFILLMSQFLAQTKLSLEMAWVWSSFLGAVIIFGLCYLLPSSIVDPWFDPLREAFKNVQPEGGLYTAITGREFTAELAILQLPGFLAIVWVLSLFLTSQWERGLALFFGLNHSIPVKRLKFEQLFWSDLVFWAFIFSLPLAFLNHEALSQQFFGVQIFGLNLFNFTIFLFCLQGLAVIESVFRYFRISPTIKLVIYLVMIILFPFFFFLSSVGVLDYWIEIRQKVKRIKLERQP